jgi:hypothetical protein
MRFNLKYFGEFEVKFKTALGCESVDLVGLIREKVQMVENLMRLSL